MKKRGQQDQKYHFAKKEALIGIGLALINFIWWYGFAYGMGSKKVEDYQFIFGMPSWFFYSCVLGFVVMVVLVSICVKFIFKDIPFEEGGDSE